jgi:hypothetical protein
MDPLTLALLASGATAVGALPDIIPSKFEREQKKRLQDLQRQQELGALGLTDQERSALENKMQTTARQAMQQADLTQRQYAQQLGGAQSGLALLGQQIGAEQGARTQAQVQQAIEEQDLAKKQRQEQELRALEAQQAEYKRKRAEALTKPITAGAETYTSQMATDKLMNYRLQLAQQQQQAQKAQQQAVQDYASYFGTTDQELMDLLGIDTTIPFDMLGEY